MKVSDLIEQLNDMKRLYGGRDFDVKVEKIIVRNEKIILLGSGFKQTMSDVICELSSALAGLESLHDDL